MIRPLAKYRLGLSVIVLAKKLKTKRHTLFLVIALLGALSGCSPVWWENELYEISEVELTDEEKIYPAVRESYYSQRNVPTIGFRPTTYGTSKISQKGPYRIVVRFWVDDEGSFTKVLINKMTVRYLSSGSTQIIVDIPTEIHVDEPVEAYFSARFYPQLQLKPDFETDTELLFEISYELLDDSNDIIKRRTERHKFVGKSTSGITMIPWITA